MWNSKNYNFILALPFSKVEFNNWNIYMKFNTWYDYFVVFIIIIKILFVLLSASLLYLKIKDNGKPESETMKNISYWKERVEFVFIANMSILLAYLFYPRREKPIPIDNEARILLYVYGLVILLTAKWDLFIKESKWFYYLQRIFGGNYYKKYYSEEEHDAMKKQAEINKNIQKSENMRNLQDFPNMQNFSKSNAEYQKYYTLIYPPDTIGQFGYNSLEVADSASNFSNRFPPRSCI